MIQNQNESFHYFEDIETLCFSSTHSLGGCLWPFIYTCPICPHHPQRKGADDTFWAVCAETRWFLHLTPASVRMRRMLLVMTSVVLARVTAT